MAALITKFGMVNGLDTLSIYQASPARSGFEIHIFANQWRRGDSPIIFHKAPILRFPRVLMQISFAYFSNKRIRLKDCNDYDGRPSNHMI